MSGGITITTKGERELAAQRFESLPARSARTRLVERIDQLTAQLYARVRAATPHKTGKLKGEESERVFGDQQTRVAGYVSVYANDGAQNEYAKAATLEYGTDKPRRSFQKRTGLAAGLFGRRRQIMGKLSRPVHLDPRRYLRDSIAAMQSQVASELQAVIDETVRDANA